MITSHGLVPAATVGLHLTTRNAQRNLATHRRFSELLCRFFVHFRESARQYLIFSGQDLVDVPQTDEAHARFHQAILQAACGSRDSMTRFRPAALAASNAASA